MKPITLTDLDGVHFQARHLCPINLELLPAAMNGDSKPSSFMTPRQAAFLDWLFSQTEVVPVTARPSESLNKVLIPFTSHSICSFGGIILLPDRTLEPIWFEQMSLEAQAWQERLHLLRVEIAEAALKLGITASASVISDCGLDLYLNCRHERGDLVELKVIEELLSSLLPKSWRVHANGNNIAALPPYLGKDKAAFYYLTNLAPTHPFVLGLGDSSTDLGFMALCDYAGLPTSSQIFALLERLAQ